MRRRSHYWRDTAIIFTMDDYGGWRDHVPAPRQYGGSAAAPYGLGFRLPLLIISPYAKPGFIFKEVSEQASIAKFIETVFPREHYAQRSGSRRPTRSGQRFTGRFRLRSDSARPARAQSALLFLGGTDCLA
jgi:phospholipase C